NKATTAFKVTVWDVSLQDDRNGDTLLFNSRTGDYSYSRCAGGAKSSGKGVIARIGCQITLSNSQVSAALDRFAYSATGRGRAAIRLTPIGTLFMINDTNTADNTNACR